ncbi:SMI1/KNR4 family protein [Streptomyces sp. NPDC059875]|uniref:SMI1/KNR4 family protein n=1 Tax=unclassified Streptomyces TaxID=2593676 RepID=UPI0036561E20
MAVVGLGLGLGLGLGRLRELLGEPETWGWARPALWEASEAYLGLTLPSDYKAFLDLYGPGAIDGYLWLDRPVAGTAEEAERLWPPRLPEDRDADLYPWPFHPEAGGLIEWGHDEEGNAYFFLPLEPDPDEWRIVVQGGCGGWFETAGTFTDFVVRCFDRIDRPPFLSRHWPGGQARYHQQDLTTAGNR